MDISKLAEWLKLSSEHLVGLLFFSSGVFGVLVFAPDDWLNALGLDEISSDYRTYLGLALLLSVALLLVRMAAWGSRKLGLELHDDGAKGADIEGSIRSLHQSATFSASILTRKREPNI